MKLIFLLIGITLNSVSNVFGQKQTPPLTNPIELGKVNWYRNLDEAFNESKKKCLPIFILFQEVPGCSNCTTFGNTIMAHPLIVEAIETYFIPLCVYNNHGGKDKEALTRFNEASWNNPVIRIIDSNGKDIVERQTKFWQMSATIQSIKSALLKTNQNFPIYLQLLLDESLTKDFQKSEEVYFSMFCFWKGEKEIAKYDGVIATEAGYMNGKEVVKVVFNNNITSINSLYSKAFNVNCADQIYGKSNKENQPPIHPSNKFQKDKEDKYYLFQTKYRFIPMTELQKTKVNSALGNGINPNTYLSPRQLSLLNSNKRSINMIDKNITEYWW